MIIAANEAPEVPPWEIFSQTTSNSNRLRNKIIYYNDLSSKDVLLTNEQKNWACLGLDGKLENDPNWQILEIKNDKFRINNFCNIFSLDLGNVRNWFYRNYKKGKYAYEKVGRQQLIDGETMIALKNTVKSMTNKPTTKRLNEMLNEAQLTTANKRGRTIIEQSLIENLNVKTLKIYSDQYGLSERTGQVSFAARERATSDKRCLAHWIVVLILVFGNLPPYKKFNLDHSMVGIDAEGSNNKVWIASEEEVESYDRLVIRTSSSV